MKHFLEYYLPLIALIILCLAVFGSIFLPLLIRLAKDFWIWALA